MSYQPLPIVEVELDELVLDLDNYRIPTRSDDEAGALDYLFASEDALGAAKLILRDGYFDNEVPIVVADPTRWVAPPYIVIEGNRRVSALKALHDPRLAFSREDDIRTLLKRWALEAQDLPERIRVLLAPDRATAAPHVARLHTGTPKRRWSRDQQATFYYSLIDSGTTVADIKARYSGTDVPRFIRMAVVRRFLCAATFRDATLEQYAASDALTMSSFEYAYRNRDIASAIGVEFDRSTGQLLPLDKSPEEIAQTLSPEQSSALEYLLGEFRAGRFNTRSPEFRKKEDAHDTLLTTLSSPPPPSEAPFIGAKPAPSTIGQGGLFDLDSTPADDEIPGKDGRGQVSEATRDESPTRSVPMRRGPNHPDTKGTLDLSGLSYVNTPLNLKMRYIELRRVRLSETPIAAAMLLRSVLESTIKIHFEDADEPATGELAKVFKSVSSTYGSDKALRATIAQIQSADARTQGSIQWLNYVTHSADAALSASDVHQAWKLINPLLRRLLAAR